jgi:geranylgeranyl pyrophosphate synthase
MGKEALADIVAGNVTGPVYLSLWTEQKRGGSGKFMLNELRNRNKTKAQAEEIKEWVMRNSGIELTRALAAMHVQRGLSFLSHFPNADLPLWQYLSFKILSRNK